jgi:hypothetical protein
MMKQQIQNHSERTPQQSYINQLGSQVSQTKSSIPRIAGHVKSSSNFSSIPSVYNSRAALNRTGRMMSELSDVDSTMRELMGKVCYLT